MTQQMHALGLHFEFADAVDGHTLVESLHVDSDAAITRLQRPLLPGEAGCALSHLRVYQRIVDDQIPHAVILEDDAVLSTDVPALITALANSREELVALIHAYSMAYPWSAKGAPITNAYRLVAFSATPSSTAGYYLTNHAAEILLEAGYPVRYVADWPVAIERTLNAKGVMPAAVRVNSRFASQISTRQCFSRSKLERLLRYLEAFTFFPFVRDRTEYDSLWQYVQQRLLSWQLYDSPPDTIL